MSACRISSIGAAIGLALAKLLLRVRFGSTKACELDIMSVSFHFLPKIGRGFGRGFGWGWVLVSVCGGAAWESGPNSVCETKRVEFVSESGLKRDCRKAENKETKS